MQFDPKNPPRRKTKYIITDSDGNKHEHFVSAIPIETIDRFLEIVSEVWGTIIVKNDKDDMMIVIGEALKKYPKEIIQLTSQMTGYPEEDVGRWDADIVLEMILDWIDGTLKSLKITWSKKKGTIGDLLGTETPAETEQEAKPEIPLSTSENISGPSSEERTISSDSDIQKSTG